MIETLLQILFWVMFGFGAIGLFVIALLLALWYMENRR